jgi:DNA primase catalytic core
LINAKPDILEIVERHVELKRRGHNYWGCCPFHSEKTPSFKVWTEKQTFYCFGCGAHGDVLDFIMKLHGLNFKDACKYLSIIPGQAVQVDQSRDKQRQLLKAFEEWCRFFYCQLCDDRIEIDQLKMHAKNRNPLPEYLAWWLAEKLGRLPFIEWMLDILSEGDDEEKFELYKGMRNGIF